MKTLKVAGTLRVPSARDQRSRHFIGHQSLSSLLGGRHTECACYLAFLVLFTGCGLDGPVPRGPQHDEPATASQPVEQKPASEQRAAPDKPAVAAASPVKSPAEQKPAVVREKAAVGMGEQGRGYGGDMMTMPLKALADVKVTIALQQIDSAMNLYKASEGHAPKTHEEFMEKIIKANNIQLPTLPAGQRYVYDPSTETLAFERPSF